MPIRASATTANRLTANPCTEVNEPNPRTQLARRCGCGVCAIDCTMPVSVPCPSRGLPCQKPRPGHACSTAIPAKNSPMTASTARPSHGARQ